MSKLWVFIKKLPTLYRDFSEEESEYIKILNPNVFLLRLTHSLTKHDGKEFAYWAKVISKWYEEDVSRVVDLNKYLQQDLDELNYKPVPVTLTIKED